MWIIQTYNCCLHPLSLGNMHKKTILVQSGKLETSVRKTSFSLCISCTIWIFFFYHVYIFLSKNKNFNTTKSKKKKSASFIPVIPLWLYPNWKCRPNGGSLTGTTLHHPIHKECPGSCLGLPVLPWSANLVKKRKQKQLGSVLGDPSFPFEAHRPFTGRPHPGADVKFAFCPGLGRIM